MGPGFQGKSHAGPECGHPRRGGQGGASAQECRHRVLRLVRGAQPGPGGTVLRSLRARIAPVRRCGRPCRMRPASSCRSLATPRPCPAHRGGPAAPRSCGRHRPARGAAWWPFGTLFRQNPGAQGSPGGQHGTATGRPPSRRGTPAFTEQVQANRAGRHGADPGHCSRNRLPPRMFRTARDATRRHTPWGPIPGMWV